jgi:hypothetical protein
LSQAQVLQETPEFQEAVKHSISDCLDRAIEESQTTTDRNTKFNPAATGAKRSTTEAMSEIISDVIVETEMLGPAPLQSTSETETEQQTRASLVWMRASGVAEGDYSPPPRKRLSQAQVLQETPEFQEAVKHSISDCLDRAIEETTMSNDPKFNTASTGAKRSTTEATSEIISDVIVETEMLGPAPLQSTSETETEQQTRASLVWMRESVKSIEADAAIVNADINNPSGISNTNSSSSSSSSSSNSGSSGSGSSKTGPSGVKPDQFDLHDGLRDGIVVPLLPTTLSDHPELEHHDRLSRLSGKPENKNYVNHEAHGPLAGVMVEDNQASDDENLKAGHLRVSEGIDSVLRRVDSGGAVDGGKSSGGGGNSSGENRSPSEPENIIDVFPKGESQKPQIKPASPVNLTSKQKQGSPGGKTAPLPKIVEGSGEEGSGDDKVADKPIVANRMQFADSERNVGGSPSVHEVNLSGSGINGGKTSSQGKRLGVDTDVAAHEAGMEEGFVHEERGIDYKRDLNAPLRVIEYV